MNIKDKEMMDKLIEDKGIKYKIYVDNDCIFVLDKQYKEYDERAIIYEFTNYGWEFIIDLMEYLKLDCEGV